MAEWMIKLLVLYFFKRYKSFTVMTVCLQNVPFHVKYTVNSEIVAIFLLLRKSDRVIIEII